MIYMYISTVNVSIKKQEQFICITTQQHSDTHIIIIDMYRNIQTVVPFPYCTYAFISAFRTVRLVKENYMLSYMYFCEIRIT